MPTYPDTFATSGRLNTRARRVMPEGTTRTTVLMDPFPIYLSHGAGCRVWDVDDQVFIDAINNFTAMIHGHAHPDLVAAAMAQLRLGSAFGAATESEIELAELLIGRLPSADHIRFTNSGTEAVMMAIKAARAATGRAKIVKIEGAYHGSYDASEVSLDSTPDNWGTGQAAANAYAHGTPAGVVHDVIVVPFNDLDALHAVLEAQGAEIAGVLIDPMPNRAGLIPARADYIHGLCDAVHAVGGLVIFDEVITFRLGMSGAQGLWQATPDITVLGKIIGGGFPVGAVAGRAEVMEVFARRGGRAPVPHGGTFNANPVTMRAGIASMNALTGDEIDRINRMGDDLRDGICRAFEAAGLPGTCVGRGSLLRLHFTEKPVTDYRSVYPDAQARDRLKRFHLGLVNRGVLIGANGLMALSTAMSVEDANAVLDAARDTLNEIAQCG
ncbi:MAG: aspartate aminotransferase family protein [Pseudomonadota bacterium]|nr:aspartate aminotransferase family protein [Pseudomonadota bacterium]